MPEFPKPAPALLGFDETIDEFCTAEREKIRTIVAYTAPTRRIAVWPA